MKKRSPLPILGPIAKTIRTAGRKLRGKKPQRGFIFKRIENGDETQPVLNLLNYTKTSGSTYNGQDFPAGYHTLELKNLHLPGQRHPRERFKIVPFDFKGKTVLDIGCNQGGMLFEISDRIAHGIGIDYDHRVVNAANKVRSYTDTKNLDFYVFNLEKENLDLIRDFLPAKKIDIVFLLAICMWIKNWRQVIDLTRSISDNLLFESNGTQAQQDEQVEYLRQRYKQVRQLSEQSQDDSSQKARKLYLCNA